VNDAKTDLRPIEIRQDRALILESRKEQALKDSAKTMSIAIAMAMSIARQRKDGNSAVVVAGQNLVSVHASQVVDHVLVDPTLTANPRLVREGRVDPTITNGREAQVEVAAQVLVGVEAQEEVGSREGVEGEEDVVRVVSKGKCKEFDKSIIKTEGRSDE
jgi:hypothetical protein